MVASEYFGEFKIQLKLNCSFPKALGTSRDFRRGPAQSGAAQCSLKILQRTWKKWSGTVRRGPAPSGAVRRKCRGSGLGAVGRIKLF